MTEWRRVDALFGTNGLLIDTFKFNALRLEAHIERLDREDINPSLQALVHARQLLPHVESFAYYISGSAKPAIEVSAAALDATHPVWIHARERFDSMPLSTFLPANLNARMRHESADRAIRAVGWIAVDCALDSIDALPPIWGAEDIWLADTRVEHASMALRRAIEGHEGSRVVEVALDALEGVRGELRRLPPFALARQLKRRTPILRLRVLWAEWGPVDRMPGIDSVREHTSPETEHQPQRRTTSPDAPWTSM